MTTNEKFEWIVKIQKIGNSAVEEAQEENRRRGIPNWYSINGTIVSDQELGALAKKRNSFLVRMVNIFR